MKVCLSTKAQPRNVRDGVIYGASVITAGEIKGHGIWADQVTLETVKRAAEAFGAKGVKVKMDHGAGFANIVGCLQAFRIEGPKLLGDLTLIKTHPRFASIVEIASSMPHTFGLSISFSGSREKIGDKEFARCTELYSVDLVDFPAANPDGLFSQKAGASPFDRRIADLENAIALAAGRAHLDRLYHLHGIDPTSTKAEAQLARIGLLQIESAKHTASGPRLSRDQLAKLAGELRLNVKRDASLQELEKVFYQNFLTLPGVAIEFAFAGEFRGPPPFGYRRTVVAMQQEAVNAFVKNLKQ